MRPPAPQPLLGNQVHVVKQAYGRCKKYKYHRTATSEAGVERVVSYGDGRDGRPQPSVLRSNFPPHLQIPLLSRSLRSQLSKVPSSMPSPSLQALSSPKDSSDFFTLSLPFSKAGIYSSPPFLYHQSYLGFLLNSSWESSAKTTFGICDERSDERKRCCYL